MTPEQREKEAKALAQRHGVDEDDLDEFYDQMSKLLGNNALREQNANLAAEAQKVPDLEDKLAGYERTPKVKEAFEEAGYDWEEFTPLERQAAENFKEFEDADKVKAFATTNRLPEKEGGGGTEIDEPEPPAGQISEQARQSSRDGSSSRTQINAADVADWPAEKWMAFEKDHPEAAERLLQGESVAIGAG